MRKGLTILCLIIACSAHAKVDQEAYEAANQAYKNGDYTAAAQAYEALTGEAGKVPSLYYNLGNAYYKTGNLRMAILNYERALKLAPNDRDIIHNLGMANLGIVDRINPSPEFFLLTWWKTASMKLKADHWTILFLVFLWCGTLALLLFAMLNTKFRKALFASGLTSVLLAAIILLLAITRHQYETREDSAIIMETSVSVKSAPLTSGTDLFIIHEGLKVLIIDREEDWLKICLPDGKQGWLPARMAEVI